MSAGAVRAAHERLRWRHARQQLGSREELSNHTGALIVDVKAGDRKTGARRARCPAELAGDNRALDGPRRAPERAGHLDRRTREVARESAHVEENSAMVLGDHVEVHRQGTLSDTACTFLYEDDVPRTVKVARQRIRIRSPHRARVPREDLELFCRTPAVLVGLQGGPGRRAGRTIQKLGSQLAVVVQVRNESGASACGTWLVRAPCAAPVPVIFAARRKGFINAEPQRAVDRAEASKRAIGIGGRW